MVVPYISCNGNNLIELIIPESCKEVWCVKNNLTKLIIPSSSCNNVFCENNLLTKLIIPKESNRIDCHNNCLPKVIEILLQSRDPVKIELANSLQLTNNLQRI